MGGGQVPVPQPRVALPALDVALAIQNRLGRKNPPLFQHVNNIIQPARLTLGTQQQSSRASGRSGNGFSSKKLRIDMAKNEFTVMATGTSQYLFEEGVLQKILRWNAVHHGIIPQKSSSWKFSYVQSHWASLFILRSQSKPYRSKCSIYSTTKSAILANQEEWESRCNGELTNVRQHIAKNDLRSWNSGGHQCSTVLVRDHGEY